MFVHVIAKGDGLEDIDIKQEFENINKYCELLKDLWSKGYDVKSYMIEKENSSNDK